MRRRVMREWWLGGLRIEILLTATAHPIRGGLSRTC
jgi:hypothetical protein